jgi:hypothetical protein
VSADPLANVERVLRIIGVRLSPPLKRGDRSDRRTAYHEAAHLVMGLVDQNAVTHAAVSPHPSVEPGAGGEVVYAQVHDGAACFGSSVARACAALGGVVGESLLCRGGAVASSAVTDTYTACAALNIPLDAPGLAFKPLWRCALRVHRVLDARRPALKALADELLKRGKITREDAARLAWRHGALVRFEVPAWQNPQELQSATDRVDAALAELEAWKADAARRATR